MKVLVVGAGAIGSLVGGRLALAGNDVVLVGRARLRDAVVDEGLTIVVDGQPQTLRHLRVVTDVSAAFQGQGVAGDGGNGYDLVILTTKAYGVARAAADLACFEPEVPAILTLQNGVGSEALVAERFGSARIIAGTITTPVEMAGPARISTVSKGGIGLAPLDGRLDPALAVRALAEAGFAVMRYDDAAAMKWSKLLLNVVANATSAILGWPPESIVQEPRLYALELEALAEARRVMAADGIPMVALPGYPVPLFMALLERLPRAITRPAMLRRVASGRGGKMPSLYLDLEAGRTQLEIDVLNGAVVAAGEQARVPTPVNRVLTETVRGLAAGTLERERFRGRPQALLERVVEERARST